MDFVLETANYLLATAMWFILGRLFLRLFIRNPQNPVWQLFLIVTEPVYRVSRALTWYRLPEQWCWLVSLLWLLAARTLVTLFHSPRPS
jgi:hypothetical protein